MVEPNARGRAFAGCAEDAAEYSWPLCNDTAAASSPLRGPEDNDATACSEDTTLPSVLPPLQPFSQTPRFLCHGSFVLMYDRAAARVLGGSGVLFRAAAAAAFHQTAIAVLDLGQDGHGHGHTVPPRIVILDVGSDCVLSVLGIGKLQRPDPNLLRCEVFGPTRTPVVVIADDGAATIFALTQNGACVRIGCGLFTHIASYGDGTLHTVDTQGCRQQFNIWFEFYQKYAYRRATATGTH